MQRRGTKLEASRGTGTETGGTRTEEVKTLGSGMDRDPESTKKGRQNREVPESQRRGNEENEGGISLKKYGWGDHGMWELQTNTQYQEKK